MIRSSARGLACCAAISMTACEPDPPPPTLAAPPDIEVVRVYDSEHVELNLEPDLHFCEGDGARMDAHIVRVSMDLGIEPPPKVLVYVVGNDQGSLIANWCFGESDTLGGCFKPWAIVAKAWAVPHELNHAVLRTLNQDASFGSRFWYEAYASAWEPDVSRFKSSGLLEQTEDASYDGGDHMVRWLSEVAGTAAMTKFYSAIDAGWDPNEADAAFEQRFGLSYEEAVAAYESEMRPVYPGYGWCDNVEIIEVPLGETSVTLRADCAATDTYAFAEPPIEAMYVRRVLRLGEPADLELEYSSATGVLNYHPCLETPVLSEDDPRLSADSWYANIGSGVPPMGSLSTMDNLAAGDYLFEFAVPLGDAVEVETLIFAAPPAGG